MWPMADARQRPVSVIALVAIGCLIAAGGLGVRSLALRRSPPPDAVRVVAVGLGGTPGRSAQIGAGQTPAPPHDWLAGTWSRRDNKGARSAPCDLPSAITYLASGNYVSLAGSGHYALAGTAITIWSRIIFYYEAGVDRSHVDERSITAVTRLRDDAMRTQGIALYRCDKAANDRMGVSA
jgi:hypothetical protein